MGGAPKQDLTAVASMLHIRLHSLINHIHRLNGLKLKTLNDYNGLSKYQQAKATAILIRTTEAFDLACSGVKGYSPIAPDLKKMLGR